MIGALIPLFFAGWITIGDRILLTGSQTSTIISYPVLILNFGIPNAKLWMPLFVHRMAKTTGFAPLFILSPGLSDTCSFAEPKGLSLFPYGDQLLSGTSLHLMEFILPPLLLAGQIYQGPRIAFVQVVIALGYLGKAICTSEYQLCELTLDRLVLFKLDFVVLTLGIVLNVILLFSLWPQPLIHIYIINISFPFIKCFRFGIGSTEPHQKPISRSIDKTYLPMLVFICAKAIQGYTRYCVQADLANTA